MKVFYGAAIQGAYDRKERAHVHNALILLNSSRLTLDQRSSCHLFRLVNIHDMKNGRCDVSQDAI